MTKINKQREEREELRQFLIKVGLPALIIIAVVAWWLTNEYNAPRLTDALISAEEQFDRDANESTKEAMMSLLMSTNHRWQFKDKMSMFESVDDIRKRQYSLVGDLTKYMIETHDFASLSELRTHKAFEHDMDNVRDMELAITLISADVGDFRVRDSIATLLFREKAYLDAYYYMISNGDFHSGFAERIRKLLKHYGCSEEFEIWGAFTKYVSEDRLNSAPYPESALPDNFIETLPKRRRTLRLGEVAPLSKACALKHEVRQQRLVVAIPAPVTATSVNIVAAEG